EEGDYVIKDADWEPPYFDPTALADDLEKIAKEMRPMLEPVSRLIDDPVLFMKAADKIDDNIRSFPEWMGVEDCCELGPHTTTCLLEWHRIHHRYEQEFDPAAYLRSCEKHLANDWSYGESLIAAAISHGDLAQGESFVERTFLSLLGANEIWRPEDK